PSLPNKATMMRDGFRRIWTSFAEIDRRDPRYRQGLVAGYAELVQRLVDGGWRPCLVTFMFNRLPGSPAAVVKQMRDEVERVYSPVIRGFARDPRARTLVGSRPVLMGFADLPVPKRAKRELRLVAVNGGLHYAGVLLVPPRSRLRTSVEFHFFKYQQLYVR